MMWIGAELPLVRFWNGKRLDQIKIIHSLITQGWNRIVWLARSLSLSFLLILQNQIKHWWKEIVQKRIWEREKYPKCDFQWDQRFVLYLTWSCYSFDSIFLRGVMLSLGQHLWKLRFELIGKVCRSMDLWEGGGVWKMAMSGAVEQFGSHHTPSINWWH